MTYKPQLFYGKLSSFTAANDNITVITGDVENGSNNITNVAAFDSSYDVNLLRVGQILGDVGDVFDPATVTIINISGTTVTVNGNANTNATGKTFTSDTPEGVYYFASASFTDPNNNITINSITGSNDSDYNSSLSNKYAILGRAKKGSTLQNGVFLPYIITEVIYRDLGTSKFSGFLEWGSEGVESDSGFTLDTTSNRVIPIVETTATSSAVPMFDIQVLTGISANGAGFAGWQTSVSSIIDTAITASAAGFPFTGSAQITGSLGITGSANFLKGEGETDFFLIRSSSFTSLKMNSDGVAVFGGFNSLPTAIAGGFAYSASNFYAGIE
jgi:hypothetical protein